MNTAAFPIQVFFSGDAEAHGLRNRDPETGPILAACVGQEWDDKNKCVFLSLKIKETNHVGDKDLVFRARISIPQQGQKDGEIKAKEAETHAFAAETDRIKVLAEIEAKQYELMNPSEPPEMPEQGERGPPQ